MSESAVHPWKVRNTERGGVLHTVLLDLGAMGRIPGIVGGDLSPENRRKHLLVGRQQPAFEGPRVGMGTQPARTGPRRTAANAIGIDDAHIRVEPVCPIRPLELPQAVQERLHGRHLVALARLHLGP